MDRIQIAALIFILCGLIIPILCIIKMYIIQKFKKEAIVTDAVIINSERRHIYRGGFYYIFSLQYNVPGTAALFDAHAISPKNLQPGDKIPLMYLADNPSKYKTDFGKRLPWIFGFSIIFLGLLTWLCYWLLNSGYYEVKP